eukprot:g4358.t1
MLQVRLPDVTAFLGCLDLKSRFPSSSSPGKADGLLSDYKGLVGDDTCEMLAGLLWNQPKPVEEIHLSHNMVQQRGLTAILDGEGETRKHAEALVQMFQRGRSLRDTKTDMAVTATTSVTAEVATADAGATRFEELKVDPELGAGLDLAADPYGYLVEGVDEKPGQRLNAGEVILEIDGVQLWGDLDEEQLNEAFGSRFADAARVRVAPADAVRSRPLWQPITIAGPSLSLRCEALSTALCEDLDIMGQQCGVKAELGEGEGHGEGVWLRGPPQNQRWAADELPRLMAFYFPEASLPFPSCHWRGDVEDVCKSKPTLEVRMNQVTD